MHVQEKYQQQTATQISSQQTQPTQNSSNNNIDSLNLQPPARM